MDFTWIAYVCMGFILGLFSGALIQAYGSDKEK